MPADLARLPLPPGSEFCYRKRYRLWETAAPMLSRNGIVYVNRNG